MTALPRFGVQPDQSQDTGFEALLAAAPIDVPEISENTISEDTIIACKIAVAKALQIENAERVMLAQPDYVTERQIKNWEKTLKIEDPKDNNIH